MEKTLEISLDSVRHTCYFVLNKEVSVGTNSRFFEGMDDANGKRIQPLKQAKIWAKENGYTHLQVVRITKGKNKTYTL